VNVKGRQALSNCSTRAVEPKERGGPGVQEAYGVSVDKEANHRLMAVPERTGSAAQHLTNSRCGVDNGEAAPGYNDDSWALSRSRNRGGKKERSPIRTGNDRLKLAMRLRSEYGWHS